MNKDFYNLIKKSIIFIGKLINDKDGKKQSQIFGTGFLVEVNGFVYIVTAKHVFYNNNTLINDIYYFSNTKTSHDAVVLPMKRQLDLGLECIVHDDPIIDMVVAPFPVIQEMHDLVTFPVNMFAQSTDLFETNDVFYMSFQPGITCVEVDKKIAPIVRKGMISRINENKSLYIDGFAFPGNSGSPVFMLPSVIRFGNDNSINIGGDDKAGKLVGVISEYIPYQDIACSNQTGRPRVIFEENMGLSKIWSSDYLFEIFKQDNFLKQQEKIKTLNK